jgi:hypothetical protein
VQQRSINLESHFERRPKRKLQRMIDEKSSSRFPRESLGFRLRNANEEAISTPRKPTQQLVLSLAEPMAWR